MSRMFKVLTHAGFAAVLLIALISNGVTATASPAPVPPAGLGQMQDGLIKDLKWRNIGNANLKGRISSVDALEDNFAVAVVGTGSGGVWKTVNAGTTWEPIFDGYGAASIGEVRIDQNDPDIIWVGSGEEDGRNSATWGDHVYKSTDGGATFEPVLTEVWTTGDIVIHPEDSDTVWVAVLGNIWGDVGKRGLFKTTDGGESWEQLTDGLPQPDGLTGALRLKIHPEDPDTLWVTFWERRRWAWLLESGGDNGGIFKTTNGGDSWEKMTDGLPEGASGKIGLDVSRSNPDVLIAHYEHGTQIPEFIGQGQDREPNPEYADMNILGSGIYRSEDGGESWTYVNRFFNRPFYYNHVWLDPNDPEIVYSGTSRFRKSTDGGRTLEQMPGGGGGGHCYHALWIDPHDSKRFWVGSDGGMNLTHDGGDNYLDFKNLNVTQYYAVGVDMSDPYNVCGGLQDAGSSCGPSQTRANGIYTNDWRSVGGGDGFHVQIDPTDPDTLYSESQGGAVSRVDMKTGERVSIRPRRNNTLNYEDYITPEIEESMRERGWGNNPFRFNWSSPIILSRHNPRMIYFGGNHVFRSVDRGDSWTIISPDVSDNDPEKTRRVTGGLTQDVTGAENHGSVITIAESFFTPDVVWAGTDDGNVQVTRNGGTTWTDITDNIGMPQDTWISRVETSHFEPGTAYVSGDGHRAADFTPYIYKTTDFGATWTQITNGIPDGNAIYVVKEDPKNPNLLYAGSEFGMFYTINGGMSWNPLQRNLPTVAVHDIVVHPRENDLVIGTHGRGLWIMDDIWMLQQIDDEVLGSTAHLFENGVSTRWLNRNPQGTGGTLAFRGENPTRNAVIGFYLGADANGEVEVEISDVTGEHTRAFSFPAAPGVGALEWNMRFDPTEAQMEAFRQAQAARGGRGGRGFGGGGGGGGGQQTEAPTWRQGDVNAGGGGGRGFGGRGGRGPQGTTATAGDYRVTLRVNGEEHVGKITVREDPILAGQ